jgi:LysR family transcriptional regulator, hydrogen peroxide-inducible genes activator
MKLAPHPCTLRQLQYAVAVASELSFRRAAARCRVSQPSLSAQLAQLEASLGVRLFERDKKKVLVTAAGRDVIERARRLLVEADDLVEAARRASDPLTGTLTLGVIPTISPYLLPSAAPRLRAEYPRLTIAWIEDRTEQLVARLGEGSIDGALLALEAALGSVEHEVIARDPFVLATRRDHPLAQRKTPARIAELEGDGLLLLDDGHCLRDQALEVCSRARVHEAEFRATSLSTLVQMVAGGAGITLLPELAVGAEAKRARLHIRPLASADAARTIALVWRKSSALEPTLRAVAATLREAYPRPRR